MLSVWRLRDKNVAGCWIGCSVCFYVSCHLWFWIEGNLFVYFASFPFASSPPSLTFQAWRNLETIPPPRHSGSHLTRSITLCLFQLKLTPFAVKSFVIPCRKVSHPSCPLPPGLSVSGCILCCYKKCYPVRWLSKGWTSKDCGCLVDVNYILHHIEIFMVWNIAAIHYYWGFFIYLLLLILNAPYCT